MRLVLRIVHDIERGSNLDTLLRNTNVALKAIATALSTPGDNTTMVQALIDSLTAQINASSDKLEKAQKENK